MVHNASQRTPTVHAEAVGIAAGGALKTHKFGTTPSTSAVGKLDGFLMAFGADAVLDGAEVVVFLFEIVGIHGYAADADDEEEEDEIDVHQWAPKYSVTARASPSKMIRSRLRSI